MTTPLPRPAITLFALATLLMAPGGAAAQQQQQPAQQAPPSTTPPPAGTGQQVARAEDQTKPTRSFFPALFHNLGDDLKHIPRKNSIYWLAAGTGLALAVHPEDNQLNRRLRGSSFFDTAFKPGKYIGSLPFLLGTSVTTYVVGRVNGKGRVQHLGMDLLEATLLSEGITQAIKVSVRRQRPLREDGTRLKGFAFPSGHASATFAAATVLQQHLGWRAAVPTYAFASYVAMSRLHDQRHFASDVAFGAAEGIIIGRSVTWHGRNFYASPMLLPKGAGVMVSLNPDRLSGSSSRSASADR
jgi:Membrane-associated phospholipid phosphatase